MVPAELAGKLDISLNPKILLRLLNGIDADNLRLSARDRSETMRTMLVPIALWR
jgi:hypothetical protein